MGRGGIGTTPIGRSRHDIHDTKGLSVGTPNGWHTSAMNLRERLVLDPAEPTAVEAAVNDDTTRETPGVKSRKKAEKQLFLMAGKLADLQEMLYAEGRGG